MLILSRTSVVTLGLLFGFLAGCNGGGGDDDVGSCQAGTEFCECLGGSVCEGSLVCNGGFCVSGSGTDGTDVDTTAGTGDTGMMEPGGPEIVDFGTNVNTLTEGESVIFTATVIDPDGPDDLQGGSLKSPDDAITYGAFNDNGDGTYSIAVSWAEMNQAQSIDFDGTGMRTFKVVFFDNMGKSASQQTVITFTCESSGCAVDGVCPDIQNDSNHCGTCGNVCQFVDGDGGCVAGECAPSWGECVVSQDPPVGCDQICASQGYPGCGQCGQQDLAVLWYESTSDCEALQPIYVPELGTCGQTPYTKHNAVYRCCCQSKN